MVFIYFFLFLVVVAIDRATNGVHALWFSFHVGVVVAVRFLSVSERFLFIFHFIFVFFFLPV